MNAPAVRIPALLPDAPISPLRPDGPAAGEIRSAVTLAVAAPPCAWAGGERRVLLVDDMPAIHEDFRKVLCPGGSRSAGTPEAAGAAAFDALEDSLFGDPSPAPQPMAGPHAAAAPTPAAEGCGATPAPHRRGPECARCGGFAVDSAYQGQEALAQVEAARREGRPYAMAFVDMRMPPGWDGVQTIEQLWRADPALQVVICTAYTDYAWEDVLARLEPADRLLVLKKPFDAIEVAQLAHTLTAKWAASQAVARHTAELEALVRARTGELEAANERLQHQAFHDPLTGLANRALLHERLAEALGRADRQGDGVGLVYIDLDRFKPVNDQHGHEAGDALLRALARRLQSQTRPGDVVARLGGDEFVLMAAAVSSRAVLQEIAGRLVDSLSEPVRVDGLELQVGASAGLAFSPEDGRDAATLLRVADAAMYRRKPGRVAAG
ncbi:MAG: hypothetical protein RLY78_3038 [Pseudomonadota bacterium]|jgi:diguanylate cyclase (GGDEF)-like protein